MAEIQNSILDDIKELVGAASYDTYDKVLILYINTVLSVLTQLGVGPKNGFSISDNTAVWSDFIDDEEKFNMVKSYMSLRVRMLWDSPSNGTVSASIKDQINELEWRLRVQGEMEET
jgi:hypothetical protein